MNKPAKIGAVVGLVLAAFAAGFLLLAPCVVRGVRSTGSIPGRPSIDRAVCSSLIEASGGAVIGFVLLPVALASFAVLLSWTRARVGMWVCAVLVLLFAIFTGFSIGLLFFPAAISLLVAASLKYVEPHSVPPDREVGGSQGLNPPSPDASSRLDSAQ